MNIMWVCYDHEKNPWLGGGGSVRVRELSERLAKKHMVVVFYGDYPGAIEYTDKYGVRYIPVHTWWSFRSYVLSRFAFGIYVKKQVLKTIQSKNNIIIEHVSLFCLPTKLYQLLIPIVVSFSAHQYTRLQRLLLHMHKKHIKKYQSFYSVSQTRDAILERLGVQGKRYIIPNGINYPHRIKCQEEPYVLFMGRLQYRQKGIDVLLDAFELFHYNHPDVVLNIAGEGKDKQRILREISKRKLEKSVYLIGAIKGQIKKTFLEQMLFFVQPSRYESWSIAVMEASSYQKAIVANDINGLRESVINNSTGLLYKENSAVDLFQKMEQVYLNKRLRQRIGKQGRIRAKQFDWNKIVQRFEQMIEEVVEK